MVRGHEEEEGQRGREGGREMNCFFFLEKLSQEYKDIFASTIGCTQQHSTIDWTNITLVATQRRRLPSELLRRYFTKATSSQQLLTSCRLWSEFAVSVKDPRSVGPLILIPCQGFKGSNSSFLFPMELKKGKLARCFS